MAEHSLKEIAAFELLARDTDLEDKYDKGDKKFSDRTRKDCACHAMSSHVVSLDISSLLSNTATPTLYLLCVLPGSMVLVSLHLAVKVEDELWAIPCLANRGQPFHRKVVGIALRGRHGRVPDQDFVRDKQDQVALVGGARLLELRGFKLEGQVVPKGTVEA